MIKKAIKSLCDKSASFAARCIGVASLVAVSVLCCILIVSSLSEVTIIDGGIKTNFISASKNTSSILSSAGIQHTSSDIITSTKYGNDIDITVDRAFSVTIAHGDTTSTIMTHDNTVANIVNLAGIKLSEHDLVSPSADTLITSESYIDIVDIDFTTTSEEVSIPYETKTIKSSKMLAGTKKVTAGSEGVMVYTYQNKVVDGEIVETVCIGEDIIKEPVDEVITIGTGTAEAANPSNWISTLVPPMEILLDSNGIPVNYVKKMTGTATAYHGDPTTSTGVKPQPGYVAVNPAVIPYGTKMYIRSSDGRYTYGYAVAADTGGACLKNRIIVDLYFPTIASMNKFGRRGVEIYILE